jgi:hypothetical protein
VSHNDWLASEFWLVALLYGSKELVHIHMNDFHLPVPSI